MSQQYFLLVAVVCHNASSSYLDDCLHEIAVVEIAVVAVVEIVAVAVVAKVVVVVAEAGCGTIRRPRSSRRCRCRPSAKVFAG